MSERDGVALGVDIGGTRVRVGLVSARGEVLARREGAIPPEGEPDALRDLVAQQARELRAESNLRPTAFGVSLPGLWDRSTGIMQRAVNLPRIEGTNVCALFSDALDAPTRLESDGNAAAWAQWRAIKPHARRLVYLTIGTGVGGGVILDGEIVRHTRGGAGHFGFLIVDTRPDAPAGRNGVRGCLSAIVAGPALHLAATGQPDLDAIGNEQLPEPVLQEAARALGVGLLQLTHIYAPDAIVVGGGVIDHHPQLIERAREKFATTTSKLIPSDIRIQRAPLPTTTAGVIGAALLARAAQSDA